MSYKIKGYEDSYYVLDGKIFSIKSNKFLSPFISNSGYYMVNLFNKGTRRKFYVHRLICESVYGFSELQVNHIDGNKINNSFNNLEYVSPSDNIKHSYRIMLRNPKYGEENILSKRVGQYSIEGELISIFGSAVEAFRKTNVSYQTISACCRNYKNHKTGGGFIWKFI